MKRVLAVVLAVIMMFSSPMQLLATETSSVSVITENETVLQTETTEENEVVSEELESTEGMDNVEESEVTESTEIENVTEEQEEQTVDVIEVDTLYAAEEKSVDLYEWKWDTSGEVDTVVITRYVGQESNVVIPSEIAGAPVTKIDKSAFESNIVINSVVIPDTVTQIASRAFRNCGALQTVTLPKNIKKILSNAFDGCASLNNIVLPSGLVELGSNAFHNCLALTKINIPASLVPLESTYNAGSPFTGCTGIKEIIFEEGITNIPSYLFSNATWLTEITIPDTVTKIGSAAFWGTSLTNVVLPATVESIGTSAFKDCKNLESITFSKNTKTISTEAFSGCEKLTNVVLPDGLENLGAKAFEGCVGLTKINIPATLVSKGTTVNMGSPFVGCTGIKEINFAEGITIIPACLFGSAEWLTSITIPDTVKTIGMGAFMGTPLTEVVIPASVETVEKSAFKNCTNLAKVTLTENVKSIGNECFLNCAETFTIHAPKGTYAINFAKEKGYSYSEELIPAATLSLNKTNATIKTGAKVQLEATSTPAYITDSITWTSSNTEVATVDNNGLVTATSKVGKATITVTAESGVSASCVITVEEKGGKITYELNGGTNNKSNPDRFKLGAAKITLKNPTRKGYTFKGWYSDSKLTKQITTISTSKEKDYVVYAKWSANKYSIAFNGNNATSGKMSTLKDKKYGSTYALTKNAFKRTGYKFKGWNTKADGKGTAYADGAKVKNLTSSNGKTVTLYAQWEKAKYTITYKLDGGKNHSKNPATYTYTTSTIKLQKPTKTNYTFVGWYSDSKLTKKVTEIKKGSTGSKTLYAKWIKNKYTIKFDGNGATSGKMSNISNVAFDTNKTLTSNAYKRTGYTFKGWNTKKDGSGTAIADKAKVKGLSKTNGKTVTLYAQWKIVKYDIKYTLNGGKNSSLNPATYTIKDTVSLKKPTRTGYTFVNWYTDSKLTKKFTGIKAGKTGDVRVYAKWTENKYNIKFSGNGSTSGTMSVMKDRKYDDTYTLSSNTFKKKGYTFVGWNTEADGSGESYANKGKVSKLTSSNGKTVTLYAQWEMN